MKSYIIIIIIVVSLVSVSISGGLGYYYSQLSASSGSGSGSGSGSTLNFRPIKADRGGRCIDVPNGTKENGVQLAMYDCNNSDAQNWAIDSNRAFISKISNKCIDVKGEAKDGAIVEQWDCNGGKNQQWDTDSNHRIISALDNNLCLNISGGQGNNSDKLQLYRCSDDHKFNFI